MYRQGAESCSKEISDEYSSSPGRRMPSFQAQDTGLQSVRTAARTEPPAKNESAKNLAVGRCSVNDNPTFFLEGEKKRYNVTPEELDRIEEELNLFMPPELKDFYLKYDSIPTRTCEYTCNGETFTLDALVTISPSLLNLEDLFETPYFAMTTPKRWIPIGVDLNDRFFLLDPDTGQIQLLDDIDGSFHLAANSLHEFFQLLCQSKQPPLSE